MYIEKLAEVAGSAPRSITRNDASCHPDGMLLVPEDPTAALQCLPPPLDMLPDGPDEAAGEGPRAVPFAPEAPPQATQMPDTELEPYLPLVESDEIEDFDRPRDLWHPLPDSRSVPQMQLASWHDQRAVPRRRPQERLPRQGTSWHGGAAAMPVAWQAPIAAPHAHSNGATAELLLPGSRHAPSQNIASAAGQDATVESLGSRAAKLSSGNAERPQASPLPPDFQYPPLASVEPVRAAEARLSTGLRTFFVEDDEAPVVSGALIFPGGATSSPVGKV